LQPLPLWHRQLAWPPPQFTPNPDDRITRNFYDKAGRLVGVLDAEGYLTQTKYDGSGQKIETVAFAKAVAPALRASGDFAAVLASAGTDAKDIRTWQYYDGRGLLKAAINGEGDLTRYSHTALGDVSQIISGQKLSPATLLASRPKLSDLPAAGSTEVLDQVTYTRDAFGNVLTEARTTANGTETTTYTYDYANGRRLLSKATTATSNTTARTFNQTWDLKGRLTGELNGEGSAVLAALPTTATATDKLNVYRNYGTLYAYDNADRLISRTDATGKGDLSGNRTLYFYDVNGRLAYTVDALGDVTRTNYNSFGQVSDTTRLTSTIPLATLATLTGGAIVATLTGLAAATTDVTTRQTYTLRGQVLTATDAEGAITTHGYNAFGDLVSRIDPVIASGATITNSFAVDHRGLVTDIIKDDVTGGLKLKTHTDYDAFGRAISVTDPAGRVRTTSYDRAGRTSVVTDALGKTTTYAYDGRGNVVSRIDRNGAKTTYAYTAFNRVVTVTTPEGVITKTEADALGQTIKITDGASRTRVYAYNRNGQVASVTDGAGTTSNTYDKAGHLFQVTDPRGAITEYAYDAVNRVMTRTVDKGTGTLNLTSTYAYDPQGRQTSIIENGVTTQVKFDRNGARTDVIVDPAGLKLTTHYEYDQRGRTLKVFEGYDAATGRRRPGHPEHL